MVEKFLLNVQDSVKTASGIGYHVAILILSATIAFSLPRIAGNFMARWSVIANGKISLLSIEIGVAVFLIFFLNFMRQSYHDRQLARMANWAGFVSFTAKCGASGRKRIRKLKEKNGRGRIVKVLGSSGYATFVDQMGDLSDLLGRCLGAQILLMNPFSSEAKRRVQAIADPHFTLERFREEVFQSIRLLKRLKAMGKNVKLKLYSEPPLFKMVILGDYLWLQHYHADLEVQRMPEFLFQHHPSYHGLYTAFYHFFNQKWESHLIPDYDLDTDELVYRGVNGREVDRVPFYTGEGNALPAKDEVSSKKLAPLAGEISFPVRDDFLEQAT